MMLFVARSALCIGVVAAAASGVGTDRIAAALGRGAREAADGAGRTCLASSRCLRMGTAALAGGPDARPAGPAPRASAARRPEPRPPRAAPSVGG